jgi:YVTN family beta-propeller protein
VGSTERTNAGTRNYLVLPSGAADWAALGVVPPPQSTQDAIDLIVEALTGGGGGGPPGPPAGDTGYNPLRLAILRWFQANRAQLVLDLGDLASPAAICFDGSYLWTANAGTNVIAQIDPRLGVHATIPVGSQPQGVCFDGEAIWASNTGDNTVTRHQISTLIDSVIAVGNSPRGSCFDGANVWITNNGDDTVTKIRAADGVVLGTFPTGAQPNVCAIDDAGHVWIGCFTAADLTVLNVADGSPAGIVAPVGAGANGLCFDGSAIWTANYFDNTVTKTKAADGSTLGTFPTGVNPGGCAFDGSAVWTPNFGDNTVTKLDAKTGATLATVAVPGAGPGPAWICFDGRDLWTCNQNTHTATKF